MLPYHKEIIRNWRLLVIMTTIMSCSSVQLTPEGKVNPDNKKEWKLAWNDEFDYQTRELLLKVWESASGPTTHTLCSRWPENIEVGNGTVRLVNHKETRGGQDWTSGSLTSYKDFQYGYFECRYKYAAATGTNNSFWIMVRKTGETPEKGKPFEIDINEGHYPSEYTNTVHEWIATKYISSNGASEKYNGIDFSKEFHTFGVDWEENEIVFYIDRNKYRSIPNDFCHSPAPIRLSEAILAWGGEVTDAIDGTFMEVDYVRVYTKKQTKH